MIETAHANCQLASSTEQSLSQVRETLCELIGRRKYELWFDGSTCTELVSEDGFSGDRIAVRVTAPSAFAADWIERNFRVALADVAVRVCGPQARVIIAVAPAPVCRPAATRAGRPRTDFESVRAQDDAATARQRGVHVLPSAALARAPRGHTEHESGWKRFEEFLVGNSNRLAYESARLMAEGPTDAMRLLFLHGSCGVGKTHLLQSICRRSRELHGSAKLRYVTGEQFTNEYIAAIREGAIESFRKKTRKLDLLVIDDVHFLENKTATQSECLHTIDAIGFQGSRVVLASDAHPREIAKCSPGLVSRFLSGMVVKVDEPDRAMRVALVSRLCQRRGLTLAHSAIETIVDRSGSSIRELEGAVMTVAALRALEPSAEGNGGILVERALGRGLSPQAGRPVRIGEIVQAVCTVMGIEREELLGGGRHRRLVSARGLASHLARSMTTLSYPEIARALGRSSHSTVHAAALRFASMAGGGELLATRLDTLTVAEAIERTRLEVLRVQRGS